ncbi:unnamed protein product [Paramecium sonneborni]|uniref:MORN repeat protein n=1 Tax=Paramecium sonneborni TaxID=65129 RepID=A0A8S1Q3S8_9CILI|nr:unnamed protein product [Paramecium sonneborni]
MMQSDYKPKKKISKLYCLNNHFNFYDSNYFTQKEIIGVCTKLECKEKLVCDECKDTNHQDHIELIKTYEQLQDYFKHSYSAISTVNIEALQEQFILLQQQVLDYINKLENQFNLNYNLYKQLQQIHDIITLIQEDRQLEITNEQFHFFFQFANYQSLNLCGFEYKYKSLQNYMETSIQCLEKLNKAFQTQSQDFNFQQIINQHVNLKKIKDFYLQNPLNYSQIPCELNFNNYVQIKEFQNQNEIYYGEVDEKSQKHGKGIQIQKKGDIIYEGIWYENQLKWGQKTQFNELQECVIFKGLMKEKKLNGQGTKITSFGEIYEGYFVDDKLNGEGYSKTNDGEIYKGNFKENKRHGKGELVINDEELYIGSFKNGKKNGDGFLTLKNGDIYSGGFQDDKFHGQGIYTVKKDNSNYKGNFQNNKKHGSFEIIYNDNSMEHGMFQNDIRHGQFRLYSPNEQTPLKVVQYNSGKIIK